MQIFVKALTGKTLVLDVHPSDTIKSLKLLVKTCWGIAVDDQRILFKRKLAARQLEDDDTLADYNIQNHDLLHLVLRLRAA